MMYFYYFLMFSYDRFPPLFGSFSLSWSVSIGQDHSLSDFPHFYLKIQDWTLIILPNSDYTVKS